MEENLAVATLNVYCPKSVIARNEELQRVFESTNYCVRVTPLLQSPKNYVLRFERLENRYYVHPIQEESEEQRNYNEDYNTLGITAIPKEEILDLIPAAGGGDTQLTLKANDNGASDQSHMNNESAVLLSTVTTDDNSIISASATKYSVVSEAPQYENDNLNDASSKSIVATKEVSKIRHALYHYLHKEGKCPFYNDVQCQQNYDNRVVWIFKYNKLLWDKSYQKYIIDRLTQKVCDSNCPLWKFCLTNKIYGALKYASEGLVIYSKLRENIVGKICTDYIDYQKKAEIGCGAFGKVYKLNEKYAVKEENKRPLIFLHSCVFQLVTQFNNSINDHVIPLWEYVVGGPSSEDPKKHVFLFVMPLMNRGGLNEHFKEHKCILEYMTNFPDKKEPIFNNYIVVFLHVFKGLQYLHSKRIVHGDVKDTNILIHQTCSCVSPLLCVCSGDSGVTYALGDMDLCCVQGDTLSDNYLDWAKEKFNEPAGTHGLKAAELYFMGLQGEKCASNKTDIWSASLTMMKILAGDATTKLAIKYITEFFDSISLHSSDHLLRVAEAQKIAHQLQKDCAILNMNREKLQDTGYSNEKVKDICGKFKRMSQLLGSGKLLKKARWIFSYTYPEKLPLPLIIGTVHGANVLYEECLKKIPSVFGTPLWETMNKVLKIITACVKFLPKDRPDASKVITDLESIYTETQLKFTAS